MKLSRFYPFNSPWANQFTSGKSFYESRTSPPLTFSHVEQVAFSEKVLIILAEKGFLQEGISLKEVTTHEVHNVRLSHELRKVLWRGQ